MEWVDKIDRIVCINLAKRTDRFLPFTEMMENYSVPFERFSAIEHPNGAEGLKETMIALFEDCIRKKVENVLVFEDDALFVERIEIFHDTMNKSIESLPENYLMLFLGGQVTAGIIHFTSASLIQAAKVFSTHAVIYSLQGMKEILSHNISAPIDNFYVDQIEPMRRSFMTYPLLATQRSGYSDIGKSEINWDVFIAPKFQQAVNAFHTNAR